MWRLDITETRRRRDVEKWGADIVCAGGLEEDELGILEWHGFVEGMVGRCLRSGGWVM